MSDALGLVVPGLEIAVKSVDQIYKAVQDVKLCRRRCELLSDRCRQLMVALRDSSAGLEGQTAMDLVEGTTHVIQRVETRVSRWGALNRLQTFIAQGDIKEGLDTLENDIKVSLERFHLEMSLGHTRSQNELREAHERDKAEMCELLEKILRNQEDKHVLVHEQPDALEEVMSVLQKELRQPGQLGAERERNFREGLWDLVEQSGELPPLADLTGQVQLKSSTSGIVVQGAFNDVYPGQWLGKDVALRLPRALSSSPDIRKRFQREVKVWRSLGKHKNIVPLYGFATIGSEVYCVSPWMDNGTAISFVQQHPQRIDILSLLIELATGMEFLHENHVIHGDLRGSNVLINRRFTARISDFGLSVFLEQCSQGMSMSPPSPRWSAPELFTPKGAYSTSSDVWSFGMVMLELLTGRHPFHECSLDRAVMLEIDKGHIPERPAQFNAPKEACDRLWTLMKDCWKKAAKRPSMTEVKTRLIRIREEPAPRKIGLTIPGRRGTGSGWSSEGFWPTHGSSGSGQLPSPSSIHSSDSTPAFTTSESPNLNGIQISVSAPNSDVFGGWDGTRESLIGEWDTVAAEGSINNGWVTTPESINVSLSSSESLPSQCAPPLKVDSMGQVVSGTFNGLIEKLCNPDGERYLEFRSVFLSTCNGFSSHQGVFLALLQRYREVDRPGTLIAQQRVRVQHTIYSILLAWSSDKRLPIEPAVLEQMKDLCVAHRSPERSETMSRLSDDTLAAIQDREYGSTLLLSPTSPSISSPARKTTPCDIGSEGYATALTKHQAKLFDAITPADWLQFIQRGEDPPGAVSAALSASRTIGKWVTRSLLRVPEIDKRVETLRFFLELAQGCREAGNFEGVAAIVGALGGAPIAGLKETWRHFQKETASIDALTKIVRREPGLGYERYHTAIASKKDSVVVVPLLDALKEELESVLQPRYRRRNVSNEDEIDFKQFSDFYRCAELARQGVQRAPVCADEYLEYIEQQLRRAARWDATQEQMMEDTKKLEEADVKDRKARRHASKRLGFDV
ncbi:hypothetical protein CYLTODRAFT_382634 [Cylindrobasidium torrendii FP15055 ss-10]|uniref:Uncharacterized protein n=1 Tax=Cylindrobasidium torrendii FP15055 ss-10 TaxID=1314674 RepID=A0A0D7AYA0_9AGAR|nr:hypothetical protein CYLTODRAFT_382634 [Cylindrobasidium torrendii FP15055 ss-10]